MQYLFRKRLLLTLYAQKLWFLIGMLFRTHDYHLAVFILQPATGKTCQTQTIDDIRTGSHKSP